MNIDLKNVIYETNNLDLNTNSNININTNINTNSNINSNIDINKNNELLTKKKKYLIEISKNLTKIEYLEIFNIIQDDKCQYSENKNGIFINLQNVSENTIDKIFNFINFIKHKKEDLIKHEEYLNIARDNIIDKSIETIIEQSKDKDKDNINYDLSDSENDTKNNNYLVFSSDEDDNIENKSLLKNKNNGKKFKMNKFKNNNSTYNL
jgi:hypothetical protein